MKNKYAFRRAKNRFFNLLWSIVGILLVIWAVTWLMGGCEPWWNTFEGAITEEY